MRGLREDEVPLQRSTREISHLTGPTSERSSGRTWVSQIRWLIQRCLVEDERPLEMMEVGEGPAKAVPFREGGPGEAMQADVPPPRLNAGVRRSPRPSRRLVQLPT